MDVNYDLGQEEPMNQLPPPTTPAPPRRPSVWNSMSHGKREFIGGIGWALLVFALIAVFYSDGAAVGVVCTVIALLIVIAVKVSHIAKRHP
jgi:hypothetical protein